VGGGGGDGHDEDLGPGYHNCLRSPLADTNGHPGNEFERNPGRNGRDRRRSVEGTRRGRCAGHLMKARATKIGAPTSGLSPRGYG
jgi:hypothetical protein